MELRRQGKTEVLVEMPVPVRLCPPQIPIYIRLGSKQSLRGDLPVTNGVSRGWSLLRSKSTLYMTQVRTAQKTVCFHYKKGPSRECLLK
jgi:hypothetical protein